MDVEHEKAQMFYLICGCLSLFGSLFTIFVFFSYKSTRKVPFFLVVCMQTGDLIKSLSLLPISISCPIQAYMNNFGALSAVIWSSIIANSIHESMNNSDRYRFHIRYLFIGFGLPLIISALPFITHNYMEANDYCWIGGSYQRIWKSCCLFAFVAVCVIFNYYRYAEVIKEFTRETLVDSRSVIISDRRNTKIKLYMYPFVVILSFGPALAYMLIGIVVEVKIVGVICNGLMFLFGIFNTILYVFRSDILGMVKDTVFCRSSYRQKTLTMDDDDENSASVLEDFSYVG